MIRDFFRRWQYGWTKPQSWWRSLLFRLLEDALPACASGGGCCSYCPHTTLDEAKKSEASMSKFILQWTEEQAAARSVK